MIIFSNHLTIVDLVGHYPTNYLIVRRPVPNRINPLIRRSHAVLAHLSVRYPSVWGPFPRVTQPSAARQQNSTVPSKSTTYDKALGVSRKRWNSLLPLDLHVLGTPPAFILSQDQTLHFWLESSILAFFLVRSSSRRASLGENTNLERFYLKNPLLHWSIGFYNVVFENST